MSSLGLGIDIGGTFTDLVVFDQNSGTHFAHKELTTHEDPSVGVMRGVDRLMHKAGLAPRAFGRVVHATTLFTNALLERRGARTGLVTTAGFRDVLEIGRERRYELFDLNIRRPPPLVPRNLRRDVPERMDREGRVRLPLDTDALLTEVHDLVQHGVNSLAIMFLHSYANPEHEIQAAQAVCQAFPALAVTCSHDIAPVIREDERVSTTVANAYVKPLARSYLDKLVASLAQRGIRAPVLIMLSSGGLASLEEMRRAPIKAVESGPAAGVIAAAAFGAEVGEAELLAFDMGGTTAKLCLVSGGEPASSDCFEAARAQRFMKGSGFPIRVPTMELIEIGAGGGSLAEADVLGLLKVGPQSAGSMPGPACYGLGGTQATVTDANFVLGYLDPDNFAGGSVALDLPAAQRAIAALANDLHLAPERTAWGIVDVVNETMARAASVHIAEHGRDPRQFVLTATGGGGPLHAYEVARKLGVRRILCPAGAGVASAIGLLRAPASVSRLRTLLLPFDEIDWAMLEERFAALEAEARALLQATGADLRRVEIRRQADLRYAGQSSETAVNLTAGPYGSDNGRDSSLAAFERAYRSRYSRAPRSTDIELTAIRVVLSAEAPPWGPAAAWPEPADAKLAHDATRQAYFPEADGYCATPVLQRAALHIGQGRRGPAIIEDPMSTIVVGPNAQFEVLTGAHLMITIDEGTP